MRALILVAGAELAVSAVVSQSWSSDGFAYQREAEAKREAEQYRQAILAGAIVGYPAVEDPE